MHYINLVSLLVLFFFSSCENTATSSAKMDEVTSVEASIPDQNPAAEGFDLAGSDARAIEIIDSMVMAYGGRKAYDDNRYFKWNFFGVRTLTWDKKAGKVRIEFPDKNAIYLLDYENMTGRAQINGEEITEPDILDKELTAAKSIWINDSYWLIQQFKMKDSGVTLKYAGKTAVDPENVRPSYIIDQTFAEVGDTPGNRYRLYIDQKTHKINTWQFFREATDEEAAMQTSWKGEKLFNGLTLSADRGGRFQLQQIETPTTVEPTVFSEF